MYCADWNSLVYFLQLQGDFVTKFLVYWNVLVPILVVLRIKSVPRFSRSTKAVSSSQGFENLYNSDPDMITELAFIWMHGCGCARKHHVACWGVLKR